MMDAVKETKRISSENKCSLRLGAYLNGIGKIHSHFKTAGIR